MKPMQVRWLESDIRVDDLVEFFLTNVDETYISHSEVMIGRAIDPDTWSDDLAEILAEDFAGRMKPLDGHEREIDRSMTVCALEGERIVGILNCQAVSSRRSSYLVVEDVVVDVGRRNGGIFRSMYEFLKREIAPLQLRSVFAESGIGNHGAHKAIEGVGLREMSRVFHARLD